jgi:multicomponent Na+:H+ antiporter subunit E
MESERRALRWRAIVFRTALLALCWWAITEGDRDALAIGGVAVAAALLLSLRLHAPVCFALPGLLRFLPLFLWRSLAGGVDVARRAFAPALPLAPALIEYRTRLPAGLPRVFLANVISLLPGTLSADLRDEILCLHVLSRDSVDEDGLRRLEQAVQRIFKAAP